MSIRIFIAEDHGVVRKGLRLLLEQESDFEVVGEAADGRQAVQLAGQLACDIVLMDISMPNLNGIEATRQLRQHNAGIRVIGLSQYPDVQHVVSMLKAGASGYIPKTTHGEELIEAIRVVAQGRTYLSPWVAGDLVGSCISANGSAGRRHHAASILQPREREILQLLAEGKTSRQIAAALSISVATVDSHRRKIMAKLNLHNVAALTKFAVREGLTTA